MEKTGRLNNLKPWKAGQSGNPAGKTKGTKNRSTIVRQWLEAWATDGSDGQVVDQLVRAMVEKALKGDAAAFKELMDSAFGKVTDKAGNEASFVVMDKVLVRSAKCSGKMVFDVGKKVVLPDYIKG